MKLSRNMNDVIVATLSSLYLVSLLIQNAGHHRTFSLKMTDSTTKPETSPSIEDKPKTQSLKDNEVEDKVEQLSVLDITENQELTQHEQNRYLVNLLVLRFVRRLSKEARRPGGHVYIRQLTINLNQQIWAAVADKMKGHDLKPKGKRFNKLHKSIIKKLKKRWGNAKVTLYTFALQDPLYDRFIVNEFKSHLLPEPRHPFVKFCRALFCCCCTE